MKNYVSFKLSKAAIRLTFSTFTAQRKKSATVSVERKNPGKVLKCRRWNRITLVNKNIRRIKWNKNWFPNVYWVRNKSEHVLSTAISIIMLNGFHVRLVILTCSVPLRRWTRWPKRYRKFFSISWLWPLSFRHSNGSKMSTMTNLELDNKAYLFEIQLNQQFFYHPE